MPLRYLSDDGYALGMIRDVPSWQIPPGGVYDSLNCVYDQPGIARMRMGSTALVSGAQTAFTTSLGFCQSQDSTFIEELYGVNGKDGLVYVISKTTGAATTIGNTSTDWIGPTIIGRPVRHFGFVVFPVIDRGVTATTGGRNWNITMAGVTSAATAFNSAATSSVTAGNPLITLSGADATTNIKVGCFVGITDATHVYYGRVVSIPSASTFNVWPAPSFTNAAVPIAGLHTSSFNYNLSTYGLSAYGGTCAASFQNRLLYGNTTDFAGTGRPAAMDRRFYYSPLPTETVDIGGGFTGVGAQFLYAGNWPKFNYIDTPSADPIVAMEPVSDSQLLILTATHPVVFSGDLVTQLSTTSQTVTWDLSDINVSASCLSDLSVQRTPKGIVWAGAAGIYAWDGREPVDLTSGTVNTFWRAKVRGSSFAVHGAAYVRGYYILSYTSGGVTEAIAADLTGKQPKWTRMTGVGTDNFFGVARPTDSSQVFVARWWDQTGAAPSMTNGQTLRAESMLSPYVTGATTTDADGTAITATLTTRVLTGDAETQKLWQRGTIRHQQSSTTAAMTVTAQSKIDAADVSAASVRSIGSLSNTSVLTVTNATNANPIVVTTSANHGLQDDDFVDIDGVTGNTNANGRWRIDVTGNATFSLVGGIGNGAFGGSPTCKKLTETDYLLSSLNAGQGVSLTITGAPNNFELHGIRLAALERQPVMST